MTLCQKEGVLQIIMFYSPAVVGCLLKKGLEKGGGGGGGGVTGTLGLLWLFP